MLGLRLQDGFVLRFDFTEEAFTPAGLSYFGLELPSFADVDTWFGRLKGRVPIVRDLRPKFADRPGPYGFLLRDPDGYVVKLFKYGPRVDRHSYRLPDEAEDAPGGSSSTSSSPCCSCTTSIASSPPPSRGKLS